MLFHGHKPLTMILLKEFLLPCLYFLLLFHLLSEANLHLMCELTFN